MSKFLVNSIFHKYKGLSLSLLLALFHLTIMSAQGGLQIVQAPEVTYMMNRFIQKNRENTKIKAWQIQIISTDDRRKMESVKDAFQRKYPNLKTCWKHVSPFYQLRAGAFKTKTELMPMLLEIRDSFPLAVPVLDDIEKSELLNY